MPSQTTNYQLSKPDEGQTEWTSLMNGNLDTIDSKLAAPLGAVNQVTYSTAPLFDLSKGKVHRIVLSGDSPSPLVQNPVDGQPYKFIIKQDAVGGRTFVFPSVFKGAGTISPSAGTAIATSTSIQVFTWVVADECFYAEGPLLTYL